MRQNHYEAPAPRARNTICAILLIGFARMTLYLSHGRLCRSIDSGRTRRTQEMSRSLCTLLFIQGFITLVFYHFVANAVSVPSRVPATFDISPPFHNSDSNSSTRLSGITRCVVPEPPLIPVGLRSCQPAIRRLLLAPDAEVLHRYRHYASLIGIVDVYGCVISLDRRTRQGDLLITKRRIADYARQVLLLCEGFGQGGWTHIDGDEDWIVIVSGHV